MSVPNNELVVHVSFPIFSLFLSNFVILDENCHEDREPRVSMDGSHLQMMPACPSPVNKPRNRSVVVALHSQLHGPRVDGPVLVIRNQNQTRIGLCFRDVFLVAHGVHHRPGNGSSTR